MKEIGSEFWIVESNFSNNSLEFLNIGNDQKLLMSGRTAIDFVLNDIRDDKKIVYMPDYCCESMIKPFIDNGYNIKYYKVDIINNKYDIDSSVDCSIFFAMSYFGYSNSFMDDYIKVFSKRNILVIEDITHRFLNKHNYCKDSDYLVCSLRKWFPIISGGLAVNIKSKFNTNIDNYTINKDFVILKLQAMELKNKYINNIIQDKSEFLDLFNKSNKMIEDCKNRKIDDISLTILKSLDIENIKSVRRNNVLIIEKLLNNNKNIKLLYKLKPGDVPLFVPVILKNRDIVRKDLINKNIYCPIHWPNHNNFDNIIYKEELSLICDQRYNENDILSYINELIKVVGE